MTIFEHEIPKKSKLYFRESAKLKRQIETISSQILQDNGFEEIVTPLFSYHQQNSFEDSKLLIKLNDEHNNTVTLRADSTVDVVRIVTKRLARSLNQKKWFYIQPTFSFPTIEQYQVGAEIIDGNFEEVLDTAIKTLVALNIKPILMIANTKIPKILIEQFGIEAKDLLQNNIESLLSKNIPWLNKLININTLMDLDNLDIMPTIIKEELEIIKTTVASVSYENLIITPLYYANLRYYDSIYFRLFEDNAVFASGGLYKIENIKASGFALYIDECINNKMNKS